MRMTIPIAVALFCLIGSGAVFAQQGNQPTLDELLQVKPPPADAPAKTPAPAEKGPPPSVQLDEQIQKKLSGAEAADLFQQVVQEMRQASEQLGARLEPGLPTQRVQESVLKKLDQVIAAAQQQQQSSSSSSSSSGSQDQQAQPRQADSGSQGNAPQDQGDGNDPQAPSRDAQASASQGGAPAGAATAGQDATPLEQLRAEWGHLPPRLRDELIEGLSERFSPVYREMTEAYYRRLAEENQ